VASGLKNKTGSGDLFIAVDDDYSGIFVLEINKDHIIKARAKLRLPVMNDSGTTEDLTTDLEGITRDENSGYYYAAASHRQLGTSKKALLARKLIEFRIDADTWNADTTIQHSRTLDLTDLGSGTPSLGEYLKVNGIIVDEKKWEVHDKDKTSGSEPLHPYALEIEGVAFAKGTLYLGLKWPLEGDTNAIMLAFDPAEKKFTGLYRLNLGRFGISELCYDKVADCLYVAANPPEHADTEAEYAEYFGKSQLYRFPLGRLAKREGVISGSKVAIKPSVNGKLEGIAIVGSNLILSFEGVSPSFSAVPLSEVRP
jgi:hypothetical protein